jgi:hypothetical protein
MNAGRLAKGPSAPFLKIKKIKKFKYKFLSKTNTIFFCHFINSYPPSQKKNKKNLTVSQFLRSSTLLLVDNNEAIYLMKNGRASFCVLLMFSWNGINVIFLIKKLHLCHPKGHSHCRRTLEEHREMF